MQGESFTEMLKNINLNVTERKYVKNSHNTGFVAIGYKNKVNSWEILGKCRIVPLHIKIYVA